ncbi:hypothetical protein J4211_01335 [Candidatus Woesearchaeota archaeon]|nr:hypothetical protein [uncultured archaeon]AQS33849.1 hypothetical protein [uncultured archaeon]MBS3124879.1 hypothetical protein [Candidatus Woesearchaeota archaeon]
MARRTLQLILALSAILVLLSCTAPVQQPTTTQQTSETATTPQVTLNAPEEPATRTVNQVGNTATYGLSDDNRVLSIEKPDTTWKFTYSEGRLISITGPKNITFSYNESKLHNITADGKMFMLHYNQQGKLLEAKGGRETLYFDYDSLDFLRAVKRGVAGKTSIDYDKQGRIKYLTRGTITTNVYFTNRSLVNNFDADDTKLILSYWRDDKLASLAGKTFGQGLTVSYGPNYPPTEAKIVHGVDTSVFDASYKEALYTVVDRYLYCNYLSRYQDLLFDGVSYTFFTTYFSNNPADYLAMQYSCAPFTAQNSTR